jgi:sulfur-carrier protein adenylyltransferase/sulfurtransferase
MKWKQFFTPVKNITGDEAKQIIAGEKPPKAVYLDVRQPKEYNTSHIPGSKLIPIGELDRRLDELDPDIPTIVY